MGASAGKIVVTEEQVEIFSLSSGMEKEKIKKYCREFLKAHPKGRMNKKEFIELTKLSLRNSTKINMQLMAGHIFRMYDSDNDGFITFIEFMVVYHTMVSGDAEDNLEKMFLIFDVNNDGVITIQEMTVLVRDILIMIEGQDEAEKSTKVAREAFKEMDKDKNGEVTKQEFVSAVLDHQKISKFLTLKVIEIFI